MIDSHCHLAGTEFTADLPAVVARASAAGVTAALCILSDWNDEEDTAIARLRSLWPQVRFATGIHPHNAGAEAPAAAERVQAVEQRIEQLGAVAVGEIGLDYHYDFAPREVQQQVFRAQVALARRLSVPIIIHTRDATEDTLRILREEGAVKGVFHCFTGDRDMARAVLDLGFHVSFAGIVTFPRAEPLRDAARLVPEDRLLVETDSPYLAPVPLRGKRNEPAFVAHVVSRLAEVRGVEAHTLGETTARNFAALFGGTVS